MNAMEELLEKTSQDNEREENESARLEALRAYDVLDTPQESDFDDLVRLAARICQAPISLISLVDKERQWFKGRYGFDFSETPRRLSFCAHAILQAHNVMVVPDATKDPRFVENELVTSGPRIRAYAAAPLVTQKGHALGTLCVIDTKPRSFTSDQLEALSTLSRQVMTQLEIRRRLTETNRMATELETVHLSQRARQQALVQGRTRELAQANAQLSEREEQLNGLIDSAMDAIISTNAGLEIVLFNPAAEALFGYTAAEVLGTHISQLVPRFREAHGWPTEAFGEISSHASNRVGSRGTLTAVRKNREEFLAEASISQVDLQGGRRFTLILRDITKRKRNEEHARRWEQVFDLAEFGLAISDARNDTFVAVNRSFARQHGYEPDELKNASLFTVCPENFRETLKQKLREVDRVGHLLLEAVHQRKNGSIFPVLVEITSIKDSNGIPVSRVAYALDFTDIVAAREALARSREELERLVHERTAQLQDANDNLRNFSQTAAHDLRAPLRAINNYSTILLENYGTQLDGNGNAMIERVMHSAHQMLQILDDLLAYSQVSQGELPPERFSLEFAVAEVLRLAEREIQLKDAEITIDSPLPEIVGHPATVVLLITNLVSNALKFVAPGVNPKIRIWTESFESTVRLSVSDNGIGISDASLPRLFGAFHRLRTEHAYPGTGLGLAIAKKAAERMGGCIGVQSEMGKGSRFWVEFKKPA